ncbi:MAG: glutamate--tRNA ligase family protein [bacterium]|nr:glutamate--tRNA ligase family protein [bacterium]
MSAPLDSGRAQTYRGRLAPSPTGLLHQGHARTYRVAGRRAKDAGGVLIYRDEDLDLERCKAEFSRAALEDLARIGLEWSEGPDVGGPCRPYRQSERGAIYRDMWNRLRSSGWIYPCEQSRRKIRETIAASGAARPATKAGGGPGLDLDLAEARLMDPVFPPELRPPVMRAPDFRANNPYLRVPEPGDINWRFRVPDGEAINFVDGRRGRQSFRAGRDFGDFLVWRKIADMPSYEFAVVVDDHLMGITEVVRGADLLVSTARQLLIYRALGWTPPEFYHCDLVRDDDGRRLAKRHDSVAVRALLDGGASVELFD